MQEDKPQPQSASALLAQENQELKNQLRKMEQALVVATMRSGGCIAVHKSEMVSMLSMPMKLTFVDAHPYLIFSLEPDTKQEGVIERATSIPSIGRR